jgi:leader peptidase (prepilin peptidase)/N-methyltransferase
VTLFASSLLVSIGCGIIGKQSGRILYAIIGAFSLALFYFIIALISKGGMGMGDVKLALSIGLGSGFFSAHLVIVATFVAFGLGSAIGLFLMATGKANRKTAIPFGPFMIVGQLISLLLLPGQYY